MSDENDFEPVEEEKEPESLRKKWEAEEFEESVRGQQFLDCPHCGKSVEKKNFSCLYCGKRIFSDSGPMGRLAEWIAKGKWVLFLLLLMLLVFLLQMI